MTEKEFWQFLTDNGAVAMFSRMKARDGDENLNKVCEEAFIKELKERKEASVR